MFMKLIHPFLTKKVTRHIFTKQRVPRHLIIFWTSDELKGIVCYRNNVTLRLRLTLTETETKTKTENKIESQT